MSRLEEQTVFRFPRGTMQRAEDLIPYMANDPRFFGLGKITKSTILRLALLDGLERFEKKYKK